MKWLIIVLLACCFSNAFGQDQWDVMQDYDEDLVDTTSSPIVNKGLYIPAKGTFKILVIFVRMKEDTSLVDGQDFPGWPAKSDPNWLQNFVDSDTNCCGSSSFDNLTQYFWEMSNGKYCIIGDVYGSSPKKCVKSRKAMLQFHKIFSHRFV